MSRPSTKTSTKKRQETNSPFKRFRLAKKYTQETIATLIGVAVSTIRRWEKGQAEPTFTILQMKSYCKAIGKTLDELPDSLLPTDD